MNAAKQLQAASIAPKLFAMSAGYTISDQAAPADLLNDAGCWLEAAHGTIDLMIAGLQDEDGAVAANPRFLRHALYGVLHHLDMIEGVMNAMFPHLDKSTFAEPIDS